MKKMLAVLLIVAGVALAQKPKTQAQYTKADVGATTNKVAATALAATPPISGRYQLFFSPHARADAYLLDTATGKIWKPTTITNAKDTNLKEPPQIWIYQERIDTEAEFDYWALRHAPPVEVVPSEPKQ